MERRYQMNFEAGVLVARAWESLTDPAEVARLLALPEDAAEQSAPRRFWKSIRCAT
jgi:hypothetical protein